MIPFYLANKLNNIPQGASSFLGVYFPPIRYIGSAGLQDPVHSSIAVFFYLRSAFLSTGTTSSATAPPMSAVTSWGQLKVAGSA